MKITHPQLSLDQGSPWIPWNCKQNVAYWYIWMHVDAFFLESCHQIPKEVHEASK